MQRRRFDEDKEKQEEETKESDPPAKDASKNTAKQDADALRMPELSEEAPSDIDGTVIKRDENSTTYQTSANTYVTRFSSEPLLYTDEKGREKEIDNTLKSRGDRPAVYGVFFLHQGRYHPDAAGCADFF